MGKKPDNNLPLLHIYSPLEQGLPAVIAGTTEGLTQLRDAINEALEGPPVSFLFTSSDNEPYYCKIYKLSLKDAKRLEPHYSNGATKKNLSTKEPEGGWVTFNINGNIEVSSIKEKEACQQAPRLP